MDPEGARPLGEGEAAEASAKPEDVGTLLAFYGHLGELVQSGARDAVGDDGWMGALARAGFADVADAWENLELLKESPSALAEGLADLAWKVGERLRSAYEPPRTIEEALEGWEPDGTVTLPAPTDSEATRDWDVRRLVHALRVGDIAVKRAAAVDLGDFLLRRRKLSSEKLYQLALGALSVNRDPAVALEVTEALSRLGGAEARRAKAAVDRVEAFLAKLGDHIRRFWDGALTVDPLEELSDPDLVMLGMWLRRATDLVAGHVTEYLLAHLGGEEPGALASVASALVPSGDPRLLPVMVRLVQEAEYTARVASIKVLAHIDDPRSHGALSKALRHATDPLERVMIARALASFHDASGRDDVITGIGPAAPAFVREEALKTVGMLPDVGRETVEAVGSLAGAEMPAIAIAAIRALSRLGDGTTVDRLESIAAERPALRAAALGAAGDLRSRLALAGDDRYDVPVEDSGPAGVKRPGPLARLRSVLWYLLGLVFFAVRRWPGVRSAAARSSRINPSSAKGQFLEAWTWILEGRDDAAIECYRQGLQRDPLFPVRQWGEADRLLGAYLRQAEGLERSDRSMEAIALLEETAFIDLRSADPNLKIEVDRRLDSLKLEQRRRRIEA